MKSSKNKYNILTDPAFLQSNAKPSTLNPSSQPDLQRDGSLTSQLSTEKFRFESQLTSLYVFPAPYKFQLNTDCCNDHYISHASKQLASYELQFIWVHWTAIIRKFSLRKRIIYDVLNSTCLLMIRIQFPNLWIKNVSIMKHGNNFEIIFRPTSKKSIFWNIFIFIDSIIWKLHIK